MTERRSCKISNGGCKAPAGIQVGGLGGAIGEGTGSTRATCYRCGDPVCTDRYCSRRMTYDGKRRRICDDCQWEIGKERHDEE